MIDMLKDQEQVTLDPGDVEKTIREIIKKEYNCIFAGKIEVIPLKPCGYLISFGFPAIEKPTVLYAELPNDLFFKYVTDELRYGAWLTVESNIQLMFYPPDKYYTKCNGKK